MSDGKSGPIGDIQESSVLTQLEEGTIAMQVETALRHPRSMESFKQELTGLATFDAETAESCYYSVPRAGKQITGESVRLAEMALYCFRNVRVDARVLDIGATHVTAQATFMDLERNIGIRIEKKRRITDKHGNRYNEDLITLTANAAISFAKRDAIFNGIPKSAIKSVEKDIKAVAMGSADTLPQRRDKAVAYFESLGVTKKQITTMFERKRIEDLTLEDVYYLKGYAQSIKDGEGHIDTIFGKPSTAKPAKAKTDAAKLDGATKGKPAPKADPKPKPKVEEKPAEDAPLTDAEKKEIEKQEMADAVAAKEAESANADDQSTQTEMPLDDAATEPAADDDDGWD